MLINPTHVTSGQKDSLILNVFFHCCDSSNFTLKVLIVKEANFVSSHQYFTNFYTKECSGWALVGCFWCKDQTSPFLTGWSPVKSSFSHQTISESISTEASSSNHSFYLDFPLKVFNALNWHEKQTQLMLFKCIRYHHAVLSPAEHAIPCSCTENRSASLNS